MTDGDAIDWKTVKIPESVRMPAKADSRTYGEIMSAGLVFDVDERTRERFEELRQATDGDDEPMMGPGLFLSALLDTWEAAQDGYYESDERGPRTPMMIDVDPDREFEDLREQLDRIESAATTAEARTGAIEKKVDDLR